MYLLMLILLFFGCSCWKQSYCRNEVRVFDSGSVVGVIQLNGFARLIVMKEIVGES